VAQAAQRNDRNSVIAQRLDRQAHVLYPTGSPPTANGSTAAPPNSLARNEAMRQPSHSICSTNVTIATSPKRWLGALSPRRRGNTK
jgi:hypothetical protein